MRDDKGAILTAFVLGGIVGAVAGLLLAPKSGKETREDLCDWMDDTLTKSKDTLEVMGENIREGMHTGKNKLAKAFGKNTPADTGVDKVEGTL